MDEITFLQAGVLKVLASPRRLDILHAIADDSLEVGRIAAAVGLSQPNVSQHLAVMRTAGIVDAERDGREVRYRLADPDVLVACAVMRRVLERRLRRLGGLATSPAGTFAALDAGVPADVPAQHPDPTPAPARARAATTA